MIFENEQQAAEYIKANQKPCEYINQSRAETKNLKALIAGKKFKETLIKRIEHIEGANRAKARRDYSRNVVSFHDRLMRPVDNVYHSTGGSKRVEIKDATKKKELLMAMTHVRGGTTLEGWLETYWMDQYHKDPAGVIFLEYKTKDDSIQIYPTYKSINTIRNYKTVGQKLEVLLFEPKEILYNDESAQEWRVVDDEREYYFTQKQDALIYNEEKSFDHPFGKVPGLVNSDIIDNDELPFLRKSPIDAIVPVSEEYARDQSVLTIYKALQGIPIHWRYVSPCGSCKGEKSAMKDCTACGGKGVLRSNDVTDQVEIMAPKKDQPTIAPEIAGYISPDLETWTQYNTELKKLENEANSTHWGTTYEKQSNETATGRFIDVQPVMNRLNKYADVAEFMESQLAEWYANALDPLKAKDEKVVSITYGRRYIIEPTDVILDKYEKAKEKGDNAVILDRIYNEYLTSKFKNDATSLRVSLLKSDVEPYLHYDINIVNSIYGQVEAQKKGLFESWWKTLDMNDYSKTVDVLKSEFNAWFELNKPQPQEQPQRVEQENE